MKRFCKVAALLSAAFVAVLLAACGPDNGDKSVAPDFDSVVGEKVADESAWQAAFDVANITNATYSTYVSVEYKGITETAETLYKFDGNKVYFNIYGTEMYLELGDVVYQYMYKANKWIKEKLSYDLDGVPLTLEKAMSAQTMAGGGNIREMCAEFSRFTYDDEKKAYVSTGIDEEQEPEMIVKILNNKFFGFDLNASCAPDGSEGATTMRNRLFDIGATTVTLPTVD